MNAPYDIAPGVSEAIARFSTPDHLAFGVVPAPVMYSAQYTRGAWGRGELLPYGEIGLLPNSRTIQYAEVVFEGLKAYRRSPAPPHLFRPLANCDRFAHSTRRIGMPAVPQSLFLEGIGAVATACEKFIPEKSGCSLYLRPMLFSTEASYGLFNSTLFRFMVVASPSGPFSAEAMRVKIERVDVRAARGGIGAAKSGGNYAAALRSTSRAVNEGFNVSLWLDPIERRTVEELSGMNIFAVIDGTLHTPQLSDSILPGVTRDTVIQLARSRGLTVYERLIPVDDLLADIASQRCSELFATGTAAIVTSISELGDADGRAYPLPSTSVAGDLRSALLAIQERRAPDPFGWTCDVAPMCAFS